MKKKNLQPRLLYPAIISFSFSEGIKSLTDKEKLSECSTINPALPQTLNDFYMRNLREEKDLQKQTQRASKSSG